MRRNMFIYVGSVKGLKPALDEFIKEQQLLKLLKYFILTEDSIKRVTVDEIQKCLTMVGCTDIPDEYIISILDGRC